MTNYNIIRQNNVETVIRKLDTIIQENNVKDTVKYMVDPDKSCVHVNIHVKVSDTLHEIYLDYNYSRNFYMPFDNIEICKTELQSIKDLIKDGINTGFMIR